MSTGALAQSAVQRDWDNRSGAEAIENHIAKIVEFLNEFDTSTRNRLSLLGERIEAMSRTVANLEMKLGILQDTETQPENA